MGGIGEAESLVMVYCVSPAQLSDLISGCSVTREMLAVRRQKFFLLKRCFLSFFVSDSRLIGSIELM
jgi:hypothetical protein